MQLWLILVGNGYKIEVEELRIIKDESKYIKVAKNLSNRERFDKSEINKLNTSYLPYIITDSVEFGKSLMIEHFKRKVDGLGKSIALIQYLIKSLEGVKED
jgi:hypothetical protein